MELGELKQLVPGLADKSHNDLIKIFGWFLSAFVLGGAIGPVAFAQAMGAFNGPVIPLYALLALQIVPIVLFATLGPYPRQANSAA